VGLGTKVEPWKPYGMTLVPGGAFIMGKSDDDLADIQDALLNRYCAFLLYGWNRNH
jgi:hypothetical protein